MPRSATTITPSSSPARADLLGHVHEVPQVTGEAERHGAGSHDEAHDDHPADEEGDPTTGATRRA